MNNYTLYHLHSDLSNGVTNIDSVTKYNEYIDKAKECGMKAMAFSEHGSLFEWWHKKGAIEESGMKYIHAVEAYLTEDMTEKVRDNYHCVLIARNHDGFLELNKLVSNSFNRNDNHFYYVPRISFDELFKTSDNIIVTTACIGGVLGKGEEGTKKKFINFLSSNKDRCFIEIGHHLDEKQVVYNQKMVALSKVINVPLIAGTDTHVLDEKHETGRSVLQEAKNIHFDSEEKWDLKFKTYDELVKSFRRQGAVSENDFMTAIENTNVLADMVEEFKIDCGTKYPHIYDNPEQTFEKKVYDAIDNHPYALKNHSKDELLKVAKEEIDVYKATESIDFMLLQSYLREWEKNNDIYCGYGRGSVAGSMVAYLLGITQMDSIRFGLNFFRFMNPSRVSNADIDTDYAGRDRDRVKEFLLKEKMNLPSIRSAEIVTFNTIATRGAIRDVCRGLYKDSEEINYLNLANEIVKETEVDEDVARSKYPHIFEYVDIVSGTIVSIGTHPSGVLISDLPIDETIGLCSVSTSDYPVSMINMKELDDQMYVKLDILGLDNIGVINDTCKILGIERLTPDNVDLEDEKVWKSIRDDTTLIFQWESNSAAAYLKKFMSDKTLEIARRRTPNFSMLKWLSFGNGLIRPACASFRDSVANGEFYDNGFDALNEFLAPEAGRIAMQETIMQFLVKFCGYSAAESDNVRRGIAKKKGTETLLPEIEERFVAYCTKEYGMTDEECRKVIKPFLQVILDASAYAFSWNHSDSYSMIGYICGYLRYYHPLEFLTAALNIFGDDLEKTSQIIKYANRVGIKVTMPKWGASKGEYYFNKEKKLIAKGLTSIKYMSEAAAESLFKLASENSYENFVDLLYDIDEKTPLNSRQLDVLLKIDYFSDFGNQRELMCIRDMFYEDFKRGQAKKMRRDMVDGRPIEETVRKYATWTNKNGEISKFYTLTDIKSIVRELEKRMLSIHMDDLDDILKIQNFVDAMGYIGYTSGKDADRKKLFVLDTYPLKRKRDGKQFGYSVVTKSIGSGKEARFTVFNRIYDKDPIKKGDIIHCDSYSREGKYFTLTGYHKEL